MSVVGYDFGNLNCYISVARQGGIDVLTNDYSLHATPSCVAFGPKNRVLGVAARQQVFTNFKNTILNFKHLLGRKYKDPVAQAIKEFIPCSMVELPNGNIGLQVNYLGEERIFSPEQMTASLLFKLKQITEAQLGMKAGECVISVPFFFTDLQRRALLSASKIAGLNVLKLVNENTSIGIAYGIYKSGTLPPENEQPKIVAFVDVGHSAVQATLAAFHERKLTILGSTFDLTVGGMYFDAVIRDYFREEFIKTYKIDPKSSPKHWLRLLDECEKLKKQMSANATMIPLHIECFMEEKDVTGKMNRSMFEEMAQPLFNKIRELVKDLLKETGVDAKDVADVEMLGGSSRIPYIRQIVAHIFNREPKTTMNADESVARGAGMMCAILSPNFKVKEFQIKDYNPFDIKLIYQGSTGGKMETIVFKKTEEFPYAKMLTLMKSEPFQLVGMYEKPNAIPYPDTYIGSWEVRDVTPLNGEPRKIKAKLRLDAHGMFSLEKATTTEELPPVPEDEPMEQAADSQAANDQTMQDANNASQQSAPDSSASENSASQNQEKDSEKKNDEKKEKPVEKKPSKITIEYPIVENVPFALNVEECILAEQEMQARDFEVKATADAKNAVEEFCYSMRDKISDQFAEFVTPEEAEKFQQLLQATEEWLYDEGEDAEKPIYEKRLRELKTIIEGPIFERFNKKRDEEERIRREAEEAERAKQEVETKAKSNQSEPTEQMQVDDAGDKEKSPKGKK